MYQLIFIVVIGSIFAFEWLIDKQHRTNRQCEGAYLMIYIYKYCIYSYVYVNRVSVAL